MRCDECRYWVGPEPNRAGYATEFGSCTQTPFSEDIKHWVKDERGDLTWAVKPEYADATAVVYDGSGYVVFLETKAEHFCAMFRPNATNEGADND